MSRVLWCHFQGAVKILGIAIDKRNGIPLFRQVYTQMREMILEGKIKAGQRMPSTRELAAVLGVSRNVILEVYSLLTAEGYLEGRQGSGTRVAEGACLGRTGGIPAPAATAPAVLITELIRPKTPASVGGGFQRAVKSSMDSANIQRGLNPPLNEV
ncbi:MAG: winged helix-turn-helix domain-containing protein, partial [Bacillota bacterium]